MNKGFYFLLGFILGIASAIIAGLFIAASDVEENNGMQFFEQPGESLSINRFEVMQSLGTSALAYEQEYNSWLGWTNTNLLVLVVNDEEEYYYDEQVIKVPKGKCMRQVGIYRYQTKSEDWKTVPIVKMMDR